MEKIKDLIKEWHEELKIKEREERLRQAFKHFFEVDPSITVWEKGVLVVGERLNYDDLDEEIQEQLYDIVADMVEVMRINCLTVEARETRAQDRAWVVDDHASYNDLATIVRSMVKDGIRYSLKIEAKKMTNC